MAIELSSIRFTDQADIVPVSGVEEIRNDGIVNTLAGNDTITGISTSLDPVGFGISGIHNTGTLNTSEGDDIITGTNTSRGGYGIFNGLGNREDSTTITTIDTGDGNDTITGVAAFGIFNTGIINTGSGADSIICDASLNDGTGYGFYNTNTINTGDGNDTITEISGHSIFNLGIINTGNNADSIIADGGFEGSGSVFLGNGKDYIKGFGSGNFNGGNGKDTLELTSGSYTVGISRTGVNFTKGSIIMNTSGFEELIAGSTKYDFNRLTNAQTIVVA